MSELIKIAARLARREGLPDGTPASVYDWLGAEAVAIRKEADRLSASSLLPQEGEIGVKIKPLEWDAPDSWNIAKSVVGTYVVRPCLATNYTGQWVMGRPGKETSDLYLSEDEAKAAAQQDYETRILSALALPLPVQEKPEPKRWLLEEHLSSGSVRWHTFEHEHQCRARGVASEYRVTVTPLYAALPSTDRAVQEKPVASVPEHRWRVVEAATARGYWGIELEQAGNDDDAIMYPIKIHRDTVARIVDAHNDMLAPGGQAE